MAKTLEDAIQLAAQLHKGQKDKAGKPYILHILRVVTSRRLTTERQRILAALHDCMEDCGLTKERLRKLGYPLHIVRGLEYLTKRPGEEYEAFIERVAGSSDLDEILVKLADLDDNADLSRFKNPGPVDIKRTEKYQRAVERLEDEVGRREAEERDRHLRSSISEETRRARYMSGSYR